MKKLIIILLIINSMGFTVETAQIPANDRRQALEKVISPSYGYLEVISSESYSITISGN